MNSTWYQGVVVGVDGSPESLTALTWATRCADLHGADLTVVAAHPVPSTTDPGTSGVVRDARELACTAARRARELLDGHHPGGRVVRALVLPGTATHVLAQRSNDLDLIVVGRHGAGGHDRKQLGSTSAALVTTAHGTVAVVPTGSMTNDPKRIRVGVGPADEPDVLSTAFAEADTRGCPLEVLNMNGTDLATRLTLWSDKFPQVTYTVEVPRGDPVTALLHGLTPDDVLVIGRRDHSAVADRLRHSTPDTVLQDAPCPVVVVRAHQQPTFARNAAARRAQKRPRGRWSPPHVTFGPVFRAAQDQG